MIMVLSSFNVKTESSKQYKAKTAEYCYIIAFGDGDFSMHKLYSNVFHISNDRISDPMIIVLFNDLVKEKYESKYYMWKDYTVFRFASKSEAEKDRKHEIGETSSDSRWSVEYINDFSYSE